MNEIWEAASGLTKSQTFIYLNISAWNFFVKKLPFSHFGVRSTLCGVMQVIVFVQKYTFM